MSALSKKVTAPLVATGLLLAVFGVTNFNNKAASPKQDPSAAEITIEGSSTVAPITAAIIADFKQDKDNKANIALTVSGTGRGFRKFCRGEIDIVNASRPILEREMVTCHGKGVFFLELPIAYDALTIIINPANNWATRLKIEDLRKMWGPQAQGKVDRWKDVRDDLPDLPLRLFGPDVNSGTFDYFTMAVNGKIKAGRTDYMASDDENTIIKGVSRDENALGYLGYAYYETHKDKIQAVGIDMGQGAALPSVDTVNNGTYSQMARPLFIYVNGKSLENPKVKAFVDYYLANAAKASAGQRYIPLPAAAYAKISERVNTKQMGSVFGGKEAIGLKIDDLIAHKYKS